MTRPIPALLLMFTASALAAEQNLIANGDFSQQDNGRPAHWAVAGDSSTVTQTLALAKDDAGRTIAQLACTKFQSGGPASHAMLAQVGQVKLVRGRMYELSLRIRAEHLAAGAVSIAIVDTKAWANCGLNASIPATAAWAEQRRVFRATRDVGESSRLQIWFAETGTLQIADMRLVERRLEEIRFTDTIPPGDSPNRIPNGSFEADACGWSSIGTGAGWGNLDRLHGAVIEGDAAHGTSFLRIPMGDGRTPLLHFDYYQPVVHAELRPLAAHNGWIEVEPGTAYTLSAFLRASQEGTTALLGARSKDPVGPQRTYEQKLTLTPQWKRYAFTFRPAHRYVYAFAGPNLARNVRVDIDVDAVQLEKAESASDFAPRAKVEWGLEPMQPAGIFTTEQPARILVHAANLGAEPARLNLDCRATDYDDREIPLPPAAIDLPASARITREIALPQAWRGFYKLTARAGGETKTLRIAIVPAPAGQTVLGINHAFATRSLIELAGKAGVSWYRDWSLKWEHIEPKQGEFHWEVADAQIDRVLKTGHPVLPMLPPFPSANWSSEAPDLPTTGYPGIRIRQAWAPRETTWLDSFVFQAVRRYKDRIRVWEFLNEPIYTDYALPADRTNVYNGRKYAPADYVELLKVAAGAMKRADPSCRVIGGIGGGPQQLTREILDAGIARHIDILNLHMYPGRAMPESYLKPMADLLSSMDQRGGRKPIWITEFSYYAADGLPRTPFFPLSGDWAEDRLLDSEKQCADYTVRYFAVMLSRGVERIFIHAGSNAALNDDNFECALFDYGGAPRKLFAAMGVMTNLLGESPRCVGQRRLGESGHAVAFETTRQAVVIVWQDGSDSAALDLAPPAGTTCMDLMGRTIKEPRLRLSPSPAYVLSPPNTARQLFDQLQLNPG